MNYKIQFIILVSISVMLTNCSNGFYYLANKEVLTAETLTAPLPSKLSGSYCPFDLTFDYDYNCQLFYREGYEFYSDYESITTLYNGKITVSNSVSISAFIKKGNEYSPIVKLKYTIFENKLTSVISSKPSGTYTKFNLILSTAYQTGDIIYLVSDIAENYYDNIVNLYTGPILIDTDCVVSAYRIHNNEISSIINLSYIILPEDLPTPVKPTILSFSESSGIKVEWENMGDSYNYILYRDENEAGDYLEKVYEGEEISYIDTKAEEDKIYYYRLSIKEGIVESDKSGIGFGAYSDLTNDGFEKNNDKANAKEITTENIATIYFITDNSNDIEDVDWYFATLPANSQMQVGVEFLTNLIDEDLLFYQDDIDSQFEIESNDFFWLMNNEVQSKTIYFRISVNKSLLVNKSGEYKISILEIIY